MRLRNRIPPPIVTLTFILLSFWLANYLPKLAFNYQGLLSLIMTLIGLTIIVIGVKTFHKSDTTVNPLNPSEASHLVTQLYKKPYVSRNGNNFVRSLYL